MRKQGRVLRFLISLELGLPILDVLLFNLPDLLIFFLALFGQRSMLSLIFRYFPFLILLIDFMRL